MLHIVNTHEQFAYALGDRYDATLRFLDAQQQMSLQVSNRSFSQLLQLHIAQTDQQLRSLEQACSLLGVRPGLVSSVSAEGVVIEGRLLVASAGFNGALRDSVIASVQTKIINLELSCYRVLVLIAQVIGQEGVLPLLQKSLLQKEQMARQVEQCVPLLLHAAKEQEVGT